MHIRLVYVFTFSKFSEMTWKFTIFEKFNASIILIIIVILQRIYIAVFLRFVLQHWLPLQTATNSLELSVSGCIACVCARVYLLTGSKTINNQLETWRTLDGQNVSLSLSIYDVNNKFMSDVFSAYALITHCCSRHWHNTHTRAHLS